MKKVNNYWVDANNNRWNCECFSEEEALSHSQSLVDCIGCIDCRDCTDCRDCINCRDCIDCRDFKSNPQRITSPNLGSRKSQTTIYWNEDKNQVFCGCFNGTIKEFKEAIKNTHQDNKHAKAYFAWLDRVEKYMEVSE